MKKLLLCALIPFMVSANYYDESTQIAKRFCKDNEECNNIISLELDSAYYSGKEDMKRKNANPANLIKNKKKKLSQLCDKAPNEEMCLAYRESLMTLYMKGLFNQ